MPSPVKRPRAPTITVDTSAASDRPQNEPEITSAYSEDPNSLSVPGLRARGDSVNSQNSQSTTNSYTIVGSPHGSINQSSDRSQTPIHDEDIFKPQSEAERPLFDPKDSPFGVTLGHLSTLLPRKNIQALFLLHGLPGLEKGLRTDLVNGLDVKEEQLPGSVSFKDVQATPFDKLDLDNPSARAVKRSDTMSTTAGAEPSKLAFSDRKRIFGDNTLPDRPTKSFWQLAWIALQDKILILLSIASVVSLGIGIYTSITKKKGEGAKIDWVEGVAILIAVVFVVGVGAVVDFRKEKQFAALNKQKEDRMVKVMRSGKTRLVSVYEIYPGDIIHIEPGDMVPVDGVYIQGSGVACDESSATGESDVVKKTPAGDVLNAYQNGRELRKMDPFIIAGSQVNEGIGTFLATAVGVNSTHGKTLMSLQVDNPPTPLQERLDKLAGGIARFGGASAALLFFVLIIKYGILFHSKVLDEGVLTPKNTAQHIQEFFGIVILCVTVVVVAVPEGLPLAVTLALAFATKRMTKDNNLVRHLKSCETMGNATVICSDKTGTLTQNVMTVVVSAFGRGTLRAGDTSKLFSKEIATYSDGSTGSASSDESAPPLQPPPTEIPLYQLHDNLPQDIQLLLKELIAVNSTAFEGEHNGKSVFIGSKTETALLDFAQRCLGLGNLKTERAQSNIVQYFPFDSGKKCMGVVVKEDDNKYRLYIKGASEIVLSKCSHVVKDPTSSMDSTALADDDRVNLRNIISSYASKSLRTIALAYRELPQWPPANARILTDNPNHAEFDDVFQSLTWLSVVGIQDPVRKGVPEAIKKCERAGVRVIMVTGDNLETAKAIAGECGILKEDGIVLDGPKFRRLSPSELEQIIPKLCVLARSSPEDKKVLVSTLQSRKHIVAVTGDGTNDAPALRTADVGFSMGITGTEVAKESSDIILMDDNFTSIVKALAWGRAINDAVKKFLQFQVTVNITAVVLTFASSVSATWYARGSDSNSSNFGSESSVINAVQLLWVNLIMDSFAALALATDPPNDGLFDRKPEPRGLPLINHAMWKMIWCQFFFQTAVALILFFAGPIIPLIRDWDTTTQNTLIFNVFVWSQIFNLFNCRRIDNSMNIFHSITKNKWLLGILFVMIGGQILIIFVGKSAFVVKPLPWEGWVISIVVGALSIPVAFFARSFVSDNLFRFPKWLWWLSWAKLERSSEKRVKKKEHRRTDSSDDREAFARAVSSKLQKQFNRGRRTNLVTQGFLLPLRRRSQSSVAAAVILPGALASSLGTPSDGRSIRSQSIVPDGISEEV